MNTTILAPHAPLADKLEEVKKIMARRGAPVIRVVDGGDHWIALEGSHRIAAASALGLSLRVRVVSLASRVRHDVQDLPSPCPALAVAEYYSGSQVPYRFGVINEVSR